MRIGVLGTGNVGQTIASKLVEVGHEVTMGSRHPDNENATNWASSAGENAHKGTFEDAAQFGEMIVNCTAGEASLQALEMAGSTNLDGKVLIDLANHLDKSAGMPPAVGVGASDSLGEQIQRAFPGARVVKTLNTLNFAVMVDASSVPGTHHIFLSGNEAEAKEAVRKVLSSFGWSPEQIIDLGDISSARGPEMYVALWLQLFILGNFQPHFNIQVVRA